MSTTELVTLSLLPSLTNTHAHSHSLPHTYAHIHARTHIPSHSLPLSLHSRRKMEISPDKYTTLTQFNVLLLHFKISLLLLLLLLLAVFHSTFPLYTFNRKYSNVITYYQYFYFSINFIFITTFFFITTYLFITVFLFVNIFLFISIFLSSTHYAGFQITIADSICSSIFTYVRTFR